MYNKVLALIGAGEGAVPIIKKAKEMCIKTIAFGRNDSYAKDMVDFFVVENNFDIGFIAESCRKLKVNSVMPSSELTTEVAAKVAYELGLLGNDVENGFAGKNKYIMRKRVSNISSIRQPIFSLYEDSSSYNFPVVVKAVDSCGKRGVSLAKNIEELSKSIIIAKQNSSDGTALVEEYLSGGQEYSIECLSNGKGKHYVIQYTEKESSGPPHFVEVAHHQPAELSENMKSRITNAVSDVLDILGLYYGMAHMEIKIIDDEIYFIEVGARGGGDHIADVLTPLSTGFDYYRAAIECYLGIYKHKEISNKAHSGIYFHSKQNVKYKHLFEKAKFSQWCYQYEINNDDFIEATGNVEAFNSGFFIYVSDHKITLLDI